MRKLVLLFLSLAPIVLLASAKPPSQRNFVGAWKLISYRLAKLVPVKREVSAQLMRPVGAFFVAAIR